MEPKLRDTFSCAAAVNWRTQMVTVFSRVKKQQMQWTLRGAHLLLQMRTKVLNNELEGVFRRCCPSFVLKLRDPRLPDALVIECDPAICHLADACAFIQERYIRFF